VTMPDGGREAAREGPWLNMASRRPKRTYT
jgi:hypothetical protein